jgi:para-nitrobenzyl esterase
MVKLWSSWLIKTSIILMLLLQGLLASANVVTINAGLIAGERIGEVDRYLGVPYAAAPIESLRWRAPAAVNHWEGVRNARSYGSPCMQTGNFYASNDEASFNEPFGSEDCLYLNVWVPSKESVKRPVLIFFHGGSGIFGAASHPVYDGARLSEELDAVIITANYRLGVFGSLQSAALAADIDAENSGSFYLLDMIEVLNWARINCNAFGCDSNNITISGHSAGAIAVLSLLRSPLAKGKFRRAISFSGLPVSGSTKMAKKRAKNLLIELVVNDGLAENREQAGKIIYRMGNDNLNAYLRSKTSIDLLRASGQGLPPVIVGDGTVLVSLGSNDDFSSEVVSFVPLMLGKTKNEMTTLISIEGLAGDPIKEWPIFNGDKRAETIFEGLGFWGTFSRRIDIGISGWFLDKLFLKYVDKYSRKLPAVYLYEFEWDNYPDPWQSEFGSFHGLDVPFVFGNFIDDRKTHMRFAWTAENKSERERLHAKIAASIKTFIRTGDASVTDEEGDNWLPWGESEMTKVWGS